MTATRLAAAAVALSLLAACAPPIPDSGAGVGFDNANLAPPPLAPPVAAQDPLAQEPAVTAPGRTARVSQSELPRTPIPVQPAQQPAPPAQPATPPVTESVTPAAAPQPAPTVTATARDDDEAALEAAAARRAANANSGQAPLEASPSNPAPAQVNTAAISDENDFEAVSNRQSIESDAQRIAANRAQYQVIAPTALPTRNINTGPNIVSYALATRHPRGTKVHTRINLASQTRHERACAGFASSDQAQIAFLEDGGPERDRKGLDPDGDGYACGWDPAPFRRAVQN